MAPASAAQAGRPAQPRRLRLLRGVLLLAVLATHPAPAMPSAAAEDGLAALVARGFFRALLDGRLADLLPLCAERVNLDGRWVVAGPELERSFAALIQRARSETLLLRRVQLLSYAEMIGRFGRPPARLRSVVTPGNLLALARFNRLGAVAVLARRGRFWQVVALTD